MTKLPFNNWQGRIQPRQADDLPATVDTYQPGHLPPLFQFSQNNLQAYNDCARRFQLSVIERQRWPAAEAEPIEEHENLMEQGTEFHLLVQRHLLGMDEDLLRPTDQPLLEWWDAYLTYPPPDLPTAQRLPEIQLSVPLGEHRMVARFDLLAIEPGERVVIVDWKTTQNRPSRDRLAKRLQTRIYPYLMVEAGAHLFGGDVYPSQVSLVYWFANAPQNPEVFHYSESQHAANHDDLTRLAEGIYARQGEDIWPLTTDESRCKYCVYRSLCDRGVGAGDLHKANMDTLDVDFDFDFSLDDLDEIAF